MSMILQDAFLLCIIWGIRQYPDLTKKEAEPEFPVILLPFCCHVSKKQAVLLFQ